MIKMFPGPCDLRVTPPYAHQQWEQRGPPCPTGFGWPRPTEAASSPKDLCAFFTACVLQPPSSGPSVCLRVILRFWPTSAWTQYLALPPVSVRSPLRPASPDFREGCCGHHSSYGKAGNPTPPHSAGSFSLTPFPIRLCIFCLRLSWETQALCFLIMGSNPALSRPHPKSGHQTHHGAQQNRTPNNMTHLNRQLGAATIFLLRHYGY